MSSQVGLRELRQQASELIRRVEAGEEVVVTVSGRPAARIVPLRPMRWRKGDEIGYMFDLPADPSWPAEHADRAGLLDDSPADPWSRKS